MSAEPSTLVLLPTTSVTCPHCTRDFSLEQGFARKALDALATMSREALAAARSEERTAAEARLRALQSQQDEQRKLWQSQENAKVQALTQQLAEQRTQLQALLAEQLALRQERQRLQDEKAELALQVQKQVDAQLATREAQARQQERERATLEKAELQKTIEDMTVKLAEAQRKGEQGSQQLQGEVLELALEERLRQDFPLDVIEEVKKGQRGGDVIQRILTRSQQAAGIVLWETKRARDFSPQWLQKLKDDMRAAHADIGVLVTTPTAVPREYPSGAPFALIDGIWVVHWNYAPALAQALRERVLEVHKQRLVSAGKGEKMEAVYDYVTSPQFAQKLRAVAEVFRTQKRELEQEKNVTQQRWSRRERQLEGGMQALLGIGGELQGLSHEELPLLELDPENSGAP